MERFFISIYRFFEKRRKLLYTLLVISTVLFAVFGLRLNYEENIIKLLPQTEKASESGLAFGNLRVKDKIFIQITSKPTNGDNTVLHLTADTLAMLCDEFTGNLLQKDSTTHYIENILCSFDDDMKMMALDYAITNVPIFISDEAYPLFDSLLSADSIREQMQRNAELIANDDEEGNATMMVSQDPVALRKALLRQGKSLAGGMGGFAVIDNHLFSPDSTVALAFIAPRFSSLDSKSGTKLIELIEQEIQSFEEKHPQAEILFHGSPVQSVFNSRQIKSDLWLTIGISLVIICIIISVCFKKKSTLVMLLLPVVYGTLFALACVYWIKGSMSLLVVGIGAIVLGVALSYCLHVLTHSKYIEDPIQILKDQSTPVCLGCLTTIGAFAGLLFTESELLKDFGIFASFAMIGTTLFVLIFMPHFFRKGCSSRSEKAFVVLDSINSYPLHERRWLRWGIEAVCVMCLFTAGMVTFDSNLRNIGYNEPKVIRSNQLYSEKNNGGNASMYYAVSAETLDSALIYNKVLTSVLDSLQLEGKLISYSKAVSQLFVPTSEQQRRIGLWSSYWTAERISDVRRNVSVAAKETGVDTDIFEPFYAMLESDYEPSSLYDADVFPESLVSNFIEKTTDGPYMVFTSAQMSEEDKSVVSNIVAEKPHAVVIDPFYYTSDMVNLLNNDFNTILGISTAFVFVVLLLSFRSIPCAVIAFIPMALSWYVVQGIMAVFGLQFNLINIIIATFIFGIGVDYSIFVMTGLISKARHADDNLLTYHKTAIFFSALVLITVVISLLFATHPAIKSIGISTLIGMSATILITYTLQPALFWYMMRFRFFSKQFSDEKK
ncbi:MAG: MMPL family transporter [Prevotella sp.]|nr:MMPL family transporter [Prevotella sp.]